jgi:hypothetical protein
MMMREGITMHRDGRATVENTNEPDGEDDVRRKISARGMCRAAGRKGKIDLRQTGRKKFMQKMRVSFCSSVCSGGLRVGTVFGRRRTKIRIQGRSTLAYGSGLG